MNMSHCDSPTKNVNTVTLVYCICRVGSSAAIVSKIHIVIVFFTLKKYLGMTKQDMQKSVLLSPCHTLIN